MSQKPSRPRDIRQVAQWTVDYDFGVAYLGLADLRWVLVRTRLKRFKLVRREKIGKEILEVLRWPETIEEIEARPICGWPGGPDDPPMISWS